jgi:hypothetical protein
MDGMQIRNLSRVVALNIENSPKTSKKPKKLSKKVLTKGDGCGIILELPKKRQKSQ